jgi:hypothetical protein
MSIRQKKSQKKSGSRRVVSKVKRLQRRRGLPDKASIISTSSFVSPIGRRFKIIKTNEGDIYDKKTDDVK